MNNSFSQMDGFSFFLGLALLNLAFCAFLAARGPNPRLPWGWLGWFALGLGISEGLFLLNNFSYPAFRGFLPQICRLASLMALVEFVRLGTIKLVGKAPGRWWLLPAGLAASLAGLFFSSTGNNVFAAALLLAGALGAAGILWRESGNYSRPLQLWLRLASSGFLLYGFTQAWVALLPHLTPLLSQVLLVPSQGFIAFSLQGFLLLLIAYGVLGCHIREVTGTEASSDDQSQRYLKRLGMALLIILGAGLLLTQLLGDWAKGKVLDDGRKHNQLVAQNFLAEMHKAGSTVRTMSGSPGLLPVLQSSNPETLEQANRVLDRYQTYFGASVYYLLNLQGVTIASSNRRDPDSFVGNSYAFRPYFQQAMAGKFGHYFALGVTSKKRGYYASYPVSSKDGKIAGVAVIKLNLDDFEDKLAQLATQEPWPTLLADPQGVIFLGNPANLIFHRLWPSAAASPENIDQPYRKEKDPPLFGSPLQDGMQVTFTGRRYLIIRFPLLAPEAEGWSLFTLVPIEIVGFYQLLGLIITFLFVILAQVYIISTLSLKIEKARLQASELRYRLIFNHSPLGIMHFDALGVVTACNTTFAAIIGAPVEKIIGFDMLQNLRDNDMRASVSAVLEGRKGYYEGDYHSVTGNKITPLRALFNQVISEDGKFIGALAIFEDITARRQAEMQMRQQSTLLATLNQIFQQALVAQTEEELCRTCLAQAEAITGSAFGWLGELNRQGRLDTLALSNPGWEACAMPRSEAPSLINNMEIRGIWGAIFKTNQALITNDPASHPDRVGLPAGHPPLSAFLGVPLVFRENTIGMIALANKPSGYDDHDIAAVTSLAAATAELLMHKRMEVALRESEGNLKTILDSIRAGVMLIDAETHRIVEVNRQAAEMVGAPSQDIIGRLCHQFICPSEEGHCPITDQKGSIESSERHLLTAAGQQLPVLKTVVPIEKLGKIYLLESFLDLREQKQIEGALQETNARLQSLVYEYSQRNRHVTLLSQMGDMLQACLTPGEAYPIVAQYADELFGSLSGALFMMDASDQVMEMAASWGQPITGRQVFAPEDCWAIRRGRPHLLKDEGRFLACRHLSPNPPPASLCVPLMAQGETLGMLHLQENVGLQVEADDFSEVMSEGLNEPLEQLAQTMADNIGLALANLKLRETLRGQAIRDALTGLFNRRYLEETLDREMQRVRRRGGKLGLMMLDLDFFKQFNDTYGHEAGDALLSSLGNLLRTRIRAEDIACRYGGEEFILILPEITLETLLKRAEAIRQGVANLQVHYRGQVLGNISISVGVALFPDHGDNRDDLLLAVDAALYQAKKQGRNTVVVAGGNQEATEPDVAAVG